MGAKLIATIQEFIGTAAEMAALVGTEGLHAGSKFSTTDESPPKKYKYTGSAWIDDPDNNAVLTGSNIAYDNNTDALKISSISKKWRDNFRGPSLDTDKWDLVQQGSGQTLDFSGYKLVARAGTTSLAATILRSKEIFNLPLRVTFGHKLSQRIANQAFVIELVSVDDEGAPDDKDMAAVGFDGTTATYCTIYTKCDGQPMWFTLNNPIFTTASDAIQEIEAFPDEVWFNSRGLNSISGHSFKNVEQTVTPNANKRYKVQIRLLNSSTPPASNTDWTLYFINVIEFSELTTEITAPVNTTLIGSIASNFEQVTINATSGGVALTPATYGANTKALISVETAQIRYRIDGQGAVTASVGMILNPGDILELDSATDIANFRAIRTGSTSGLISVTYSS